MENLLKGTLFIFPFLLGVVASVQIFMQLYQLKVKYFLKFVIILIVLAKVKSSEISNPLIYVSYLAIFQTFLSILWPWSVNIKNFNF